ncbi:actin-like 2/3 complex subunit 3-like protein [Perkinsela sp. CCAP 1560/4]|nr:actin-like 2/3 complex subunit 3-like protein [Perkinsela sp. CCAP 1560/4]|eukprot:KNH04059.1 actin-like 2/3 complex subunit 3-like protein [Perkinsela sp. CCAP 1560/4]
MKSSPIVVISRARESQFYQLARETVIDTLYIFKSMPSWFSSSEYKKVLKVIKHAENNRGRIVIPPGSNVNPDVVEKILNARRQGIFFATWDLTKLNQLYLFIMLYFCYQAYRVLQVIERREKFGEAEIAKRECISDDYDEPIRHLVRN